MNWIIEQYIPIAEMIGKTFGSDCEVVIHDLSVPQSSVVYTINGHVTGRQVGQSFDHLITQVLLNQNFSNDCAVNYYFHTSDGRLIKSSTALIRNSQKKVVGAMCININTTKLTSLAKYLNELLPNILDVQEQLAESAGVYAEPENIIEIADDLIDRIIGNRNVSEIHRDEKIELIRFMEKKGIFLIKGTIDKVAAKLGISKVTVYSYIDEAKGKNI